MNQITLMSIGNELLRGDIVDTNAAYLSRELREAGFDVVEQVTSGDAPKALRESFKRLSAKAHIVVVTGGLGPTEDDITREMLAKVGKKTLHFDPRAWRDIEKRFAFSGKVPQDINRRQAMMPSGAMPFYNNHGTAPGMAVKINKAWFCLMPGVPREMKHMTAERLLPFLRKQFAKAVPEVVNTIKCFGVGESEAQERLGRLIDREQDPRVDVTVKDSVLTLKLITLKIRGHKARLRTLQNQVEDALGEYIWTREDQSLAEALVQSLTTQGMTISCAESCTGGMLASNIVDVSGSSAVFMSGVVCYSNDAKRKLIDVPAAILRKYGAVSEACAAAMVEGIYKISKTDLSISTTGIAGPGGGTLEKPVGTVCFGLKRKGRKVRTFTKRFHGDRETVRQRATNWALKALLDEACK